MNVCEPVSERSLIHHTYACRKGRGQVAALAAARSHCRRYAWFLKLDIRKYFDSVDHSILFRLLTRRFKDPRVLLLFQRLLETYQTAPGKGLPIGNLTSQHFANFYLDRLDRFVTETCRPGGYIRYMDDFVLWDPNRERLRSWRDTIEAFLEAQLALKLKERAPVQPVARGLNFLGFRLYPGLMRLAVRSRKRLARQYRACQNALRCGLATELEMQQRLGALFAFARQADSVALRQSILRRFGDLAE